MNKILSLVGFFFCCLCSASGQEKPIRVGTQEALRAALAKAKPSTIITMLNGEWKDLQLEVNVSGKAGEPVTIRAQDRGKVILTGQSSILLNGDHVHIDGLYFTRGAATGNAVISFNGDSGRLTQTAIVDYNPSGARDYHWVYFRGSGNRVDHCFFKGKRNSAPVVANDPSGARHNSITYNHFKEHRAVAGQRQAILVGGPTGLEGGAYFTVAHNLFEKATGDAEIISLRASRNTVRNNTFLASFGGIGVTGHFNKIESNYILGEDAPGSAGIRIAGRGHRVVNNYISGIREDGIQLLRGHPGDSAREQGGYLQVKDVLIAHNTIAKTSGSGIIIGASRSYTPSGVLPDSTKVINNLIFEVKGRGIAIIHRDAFAQDSGYHVFQGNISYRSAGNDVHKGIRDTDPGMHLEEGMYGLRVLSAAVDRGAIMDLRTDIHGQARINRMDVGADETGAGKVLHRPLTEKMVGADWVIRARAAGARNF